MENKISFADAMVTISIAGYFPCKPNWSIPKKKGMSDCLFFIEKGEGWIELDGDKIKTKAGDLHIFKQGQTCEMTHDPKNCFNVYSVIFLFQQPGLQRPFEKLSLSRTYRLSAAQQDELVGQYKPLILSFNDQSPMGDLRAKSILLNIISEIIEWEKTLTADKKVKSNSKAYPLDTRISEMIRFIENNLSAEITVPKLAKKCHLTTSHFSKLFKEETGESPVSFVRSKRVNHAKALLMSTDKSINIIAAELGFEDHFYFSRTFKQLTGMSPKQFKESLKNPFF